MTETTRLHPVFQHRRRMALVSTLNKFDSVMTDSQIALRKFPQSIDFLHEDYGRYLKPEVMAYDAFYALHELFQFSAASIDQLLELFEHSIRTTSHSSISELLLAKPLVDDYRRYVKDILEIVCARGGPKWPQAAEPKHREKANRAAEQLESRYQRLLDRCDRLSDFCASSITILTNFETQRQTDKAIEQMDRISKLSVLAYVYIPLTFAAGFYGMNFKELGNHLSIWTYFVMAVPLLVLSLIAWFVNIQEVWVLFRKTWRRL